MLHGQDILPAHLNIVEYVLIILTGILYPCLFPVVLSQQESQISKAITYVLTVMLPDRHDGFKPRNPPDRLF